MSNISQMIRWVDQSVYLFLNGFAGGPFVDHIAYFAVASNLFKGVLFITIYWYFWHRPGSNRERDRRAIISVVIGALLTVIVCRTVAELTPFRLRPIYDSSIAHRAYTFSITSNLESWSAFPSDTAAFFFALACGIAHLSRFLRIPILLYTAVWIALPRMYFGAHWASDIIAGGVIAMIVVRFSLGSLQSKVAPPILALLKRNPQVFYALAFVAAFEMASVFAESRFIAHTVSGAARVGPHLALLTYSVLALIVVLVSALLVFRTWKPSRWTSEHLLSNHRVMGHDLPPLPSYDSLRCVRHREKIHKESPGAKSAHPGPWKAL